MKISKIKNFSALLLLSGLSQAIYAQSVVAANPGQTGTPLSTKLPHYLEDPLVWLGFFLLILIGTTVFSLYQSVKALSGKTYVEEIIQPSNKVYKETLWHKLMKGMTKSVPIEQEKDIMLDHNYDGIRELDNQLPPWWIWGFYFTIAFAVVYLLSYHVAGTGMLSIQEYEDEMQKAKLAKEERMKNSSDNVTFENVVVLTGKEDIAAGKATYVKLCVTCHGNEGQGNVGPNLTDQFWLNGGGIHNVFHTITEGVPAKGMISWKTQLSPKQIQKVASFILTFQGTSPQGAKEPQGEKWIEVSKNDSTTTAASIDSTSGSAKKQ
jgi:cytochrome c oxidase cbb3-type subunit III